MIRQKACPHNVSGVIYCLAKRSQVAATACEFNQMGDVVRTKFKASPADRRTEDLCGLQGLGLFIIAVLGEFPQVECLLQV